MDQFYLNYIPFPCSVNSSTKNIGRRGRAKSEKYIYFQRQMWSWSAIYKDRVKECKDWLKNNKGYLSLDITLLMPRDHIYTKKGTIRRLDASNYIKTLEDTLTNILGFDDSEIFNVSINKSINPNDKARKSWVIVKLYFIDNIIYKGF